MPEIGSLELHFNSSAARVDKIGGLQGERRAAGARRAARARRKSVTQFKVNGT
jgi:hypothetical protein